MCHCIIRERVQLTAPWGPKPLRPPQLRAVAPEQVDLEFCQAWDDLEWGSLAPPHGLASLLAHRTRNAIVCSRKSDSRMCPRLNSTEENVNP